MQKDNNEKINGKRIKELEKSGMPIDEKDLDQVTGGSFFTTKCAKCGREIPIGTPCSCKFPVVAFPPLSK